MVVDFHVGAHDILEGLETVAVVDGVGLGDDDGAADFHPLPIEHGADGVVGTGVVAVAVTCTVRVVNVSQKWSFLYEKNSLYFLPHFHAVFLTF